MKKASKLNAAVTSSADYENMVNLLAVYTEADIRLKALEAGANHELMDILDEHKPEYAKLQATLTEAETALELIARSHPDWFETKQSIKTPYGGVKFHTSTVLQVDNEEASIILINHDAETNPDVKAKGFVKKVEVLNIEALENCDDATLAKYRVKRVKKINFSVSPAKVDMGKAIKEAAKDQPQAAAA